MAQKNQGCLRDQIWQSIGVFVAIITLVIAILAWFLPSPLNHFQVSSPSSTQTPDASKATSTVATSTGNTIVQLWPSYSGTVGTSLDRTPIIGMVLTVDSQDQEGKVIITQSYTFSVTFSCTGRVTVNRHLTLHCSLVGSNSDAHDIDAKVEDDGSIYGTQTSPEGESRQLLLFPKS